MVNADVQNLITICQNFLTGITSAKDYVSAFDDAFYEMPDDNFTGDEISIFSSIFDDNEMFEPNDAIRQDDESYIDESELRRRVQNHISKLTA